MSGLQFLLLSGAQITPQLEGSVTISDLRKSLAKALGVLELAIKLCCGGAVLSDYMSDTDPISDLAAGSRITVILSAVCVRCNQRFNPGLPADDPQQPGACRHHNGRIRCSDAERGTMTFKDHCCRQACCWRAKRSEGCCTTMAHSTSDRRCNACGAWREASATSDTCTVHPARYVSLWRLRGRERKRRQVKNKLALLANPDTAKDLKLDYGDYVRVRHGIVPKNGWPVGVTHESIGQICGCTSAAEETQWTVRFDNGNILEFSGDELEFVTPPNFEVDRPSNPHWACCGNERFQSDGCKMQAHDWEIP